MTSSEWNFDFLSAGKLTITQQSIDLLQVEFVVFLTKKVAAANGLFVHVCISCSIVSINLFVVLVRLNARMVSNITFARLGINGITISTCSDLIDHSALIQNSLL